MQSALAAAMLAFCATAAVAAPVRSDVGAWTAGHQMDILTELDALTRLPSVAANPQGLEQTAEALEVQLRSRGFQTKLLSPAAGGPKAVVGWLDTPGAKRTVTFYAHYDGQPVTPSQWASDPLAPVMRTGPLASKPDDVDWRAARAPLNPEWRFFGRAIADDKASIVAFLAAFDALKATGHRPSVNLKVFWEGEEEAGSPHLPELLAGNANLLKADLWLIGDGPVHQSRTPTIYFGARGMLALDATIYGPLTPLHDGHYGNWVPNPASMAAELIGQMRDDNGKVLIPGFDQGMRPLTASDRAALAALPPVEADLKREFGIGRSEGAEGLTASTLRPALNVRGISAGQVGPAANNAIPTEAEVSFDFRLVPDQHVEAVKRAVEAFLAAKGWTIVRDTPDLATREAHPRVIRLQWAPGGYDGLRTDPGLPVSRAVIASATAAAGRPVAILPIMGASVPIALFHDALGAPIVGLPVVNHDDTQHAPNENLRLQNLWDGIQTYAGLIADLDW